MKNRVLIPAAIALMVISADARAADDDGAEATIRLMGPAEAELPDAVTKTIELPDHLRLTEEDQATTVEKSRNGLKKADERHDRREKGLSRADLAREHGEEMSEKAKEVRENKGRSGDRPDPPDRPDLPDQP